MSSSILPYHADLTIIFTFMRPLYRELMIKFTKIIIFWGICDLGYILWYLSWNVYNSRIPFYSDFIGTIGLESSLPFKISIWIGVVTFILQVSMLLSGFYLLMHNKIGAILSYIQTPFRLLYFIPPSLFFILWPLGYIFNTELFYIGFSLVIITELLKMLTVISWHININKTYNNPT